MPTDLMPLNNKILLFGIIQFEIDLKMLHFASIKATIGSHSI